MRDGGTIIEFCILSVMKAPNTEPGLFFSSRSRSPTEIQYGEGNDRSLDGMLVRYAFLKDIKLDGLTTAAILSY